MIGNMIHAKLSYGVYHAANRGYCTWFEFAKEILKLTGFDSSLTPAKTTQSPGKANRPKFSALRSTKLSKYGLQMRGWREALHDYLLEKGHLNQHE
jgi:dTDP-4-dehydrorhamnose reductase